jgi:hypothetical protein
MKSEFFVQLIASKFQKLTKITITLLFLFSFPCFSFGQSVYADIWVTEDSVNGYAGMSGSYSMGSHIDTTSVSLNGAYASGGNYASVSVPLYEGTFYLYASTDSYCPDSGSSYGGGSISIQKQVCVDECAACKIVRQQQTNAAYLNAAACEGAAFGLYEAAVQVCNNQNYCKPDHADYNPGQCDQCKNTALAILGTATGVCGVKLATDLNNRTNCEAMKKDVNCNLVQCYNP